MSDASNPGSSGRPTATEASEVLLLQGNVLDELSELVQANDQTDPDKTAISTSPCSKPKPPTP